MDGWGTTQVMKRWSELYNANDDRGGDTTDSDAADLSYLVFISESHAYRESLAFDRDAAFWRFQVPSLPAPLVQRDGGYQRRTRCQRRIP